MNEWMNTTDFHLLEEISTKTVLKRRCVSYKYAMAFLWHLRPQGALH